MSLHLKKLCVGVTDLAHLKKIQSERLKRVGGLYHETKQMPKRGAQLVEGGSLYWIMKGAFCVRQRILAVEKIENTLEPKQSFCRLTLDKTLVPLIPISHNPFQGWRYLEGRTAPCDQKEGDEALPLELQQELLNMGLLD